MHLANIVRMTDLREKTVRRLTAMVACAALLAGCGGDSKPVAQSAGDTQGCAHAGLGARIAAAAITQSVARKTGPVRRSPVTQERASMRPCYPIACFGFHPDGGPCIVAPLWQDGVSRRRGWRWS